MILRLLPTRLNLQLAAFAVGVAWVVGVLLHVSQPWQTVEARFFDWMSELSAPRKSVLPITIIGIDDEALARVGKPWPWPRDIHARLIERLVQEKAAVIAFDLPLSDSVAPVEDEALAAAIRSAGNVVLAAEHAYTETASVRFWRRIDPSPLLVAAGPAIGGTTLVLDDDAVVRLFPDTDDAFWLQVVRTLIKARPGMVQLPEVPAPAMVRHLGPAGTYPYVSYHQVLSADPSVPAGFFTDQVVLIGRDVRAPLAARSAQADSLATPFLRRSRMLTPGVEVQATLIENALMGQALHPASNAYNLLVLTVTLLLAGVALAYWHPVRSTVVMLVLAAAVTGLSYWLFTEFSLWQHTGVPLAGLLLSMVLMGVGAYRTERRRVNELRNAFRKYVSPDLVNEIVANPQQLKLGGERRELTLLFCDLANFTTMCEKLPAEAVVDVVNLYATEMTRIVMAHSGTVDKFIGDAVMAFWGAPLPDADHALHAVQAARDMQEAMEKLQPRFNALGAGRLGLRIGIHTGQAIVGNLGSEQRLEYTAIGDTVNLASRLEGANKVYGTGILLSSDTADRLAGAVRLRRIDRAVVKGRSQAVDVYTPCDNALLLRASEELWDAWMRRDWPAVASAAALIQSVDPYDGMARVFEERARDMQAGTLPADWDGATSLEKL